MLDLIFPKICPFCECIADRDIVCDKCLSTIRFIGKQSICDKCGAPFAPAESRTMHLCDRCFSGGFSFHKARSVAYYDGLLKEILHKFKYEGKLHLSGVASRILINNFPEDFDAVDVVVPVPLHISKLRSREYNQSAVMGWILAKHLGAEVELFALRKTRDTAAQFQIKTEEERRRNVEGVFSVAHSGKVKGKSILLVDDVFTTGSTTNECARVLIESGVGSVQVLTLMRSAKDFI